MTTQHTTNTTTLPREAARALELELPNRVPAVKNAQYWEAGEKYGKRRVYINFIEETVLEALSEYCHKSSANAAAGWLRREGKCWFDLDSAELQGLNTERLSCLGKRQTENAQGVLEDLRAEVEAACNAILRPWLEKLAEDPLDQIF